MALSNDIILRPRFKFDVNTDNEKLLKGFEDTKNSQSDFIITRIDAHVFIKFPKQKQHFWSPQLHIEIDKNEKQSTTIHGLFGPNPSVWTMFMFFHFIVAGLFIAFGIWTYTNITLGNSYATPLFLNLFMVIIWALLYVAGRLGKAKGKPEMHTLHNFMKETLRTYR
ncbi:GTP-binding protein [Winogradskyella sp.]|nr:GTP-binding protein [Winogradskyella sp.]